MIDKKLLEECGCDDDYEICLKYLQKCMPELNIEFVSQMDYYLVGRDEFIKTAKECLSKKKE